MPVFGSARVYNACQFVFTELLPYVTGWVSNRPDPWVPTPVEIPDPSRWNFSLVRDFTLPAILAAGGYPRGGSHICFMPEVLYLYGFVLFLLLHSFPAKVPGRLFRDGGLQFVRAVLLFVFFCRSGCFIGWAVNASPELWGVTAYMTGRAEAILSASLSGLLFCAVGSLERIFVAIRGDRRWLSVSFFFLLVYATTTTFQCYESSTFVWNWELLAAAVLGLLWIASTRAQPDLVFRYLVLNVFGTNALAIGLLHCYSATAFLDFFRVRWLSYTAEGSVVLTSPQAAPRFFVVVVILGLLLKVAAIPAAVGGQSIYLRAGLKFYIFFFWIVKLAYLCAVLRIFSLSGTLLPPYTVFAWLSSISAICLLLGSLGGVGARSIGPIWAYSSTQHVGYILAMLTVSYGSVLVLSWTVFYMVIYALTMLLFSILLVHCASNRVAGLSKVWLPASAGVASALIFSLAGCPPFAGFFSKFCAFVVVSSWPAPFLSAILVLSAVVSIVYYGRMALNIVLPFLAVFSWGARFFKRADGNALKIFAVSQRDGVVFLLACIFFALPVVALPNLFTCCVSWTVFFLAPYARATPYLQHIAFQMGQGSADVGSANAQTAYNWPAVFLSSLMMFRGGVWPEYTRGRPLLDTWQYGVPVPPSLVYGPVLGPVMLLASFGPSTFQVTTDSTTMPLFFSERIVPPAVQSESELRYILDIMDTGTYPELYLNRQGMSKRYPALSPYRTQRNLEVAEASVLRVEDNFSGPAAVPSGGWHFDKPYDLKEIGV
jgi:NADH:ubiquinone oxidoreductase subunit 2 (subunit N)